MSLPQKKFREAVFQILYSFTLDDKCDDLVIPLVMKTLKISKKNTENAFEKAKKIFMAREQMDSYIKEASTAYEFHRISSVEKTILRLALYEIFFEPSLDHNISIAEAIRLTKKFSSSESAGYVHAILDAAYKNFKK
ncbi:MAG: transcription antitermination factor NusB [Simkaniaceae bacterium]